MRHWTEQIQRDLLRSRKGYVHFLCFLLLRLLCWAAESSEFNYHVKPLLKRTCRILTPCLIVNISCSNRCLFLKSSQCFLGAYCMFQSEVRSPLILFPLAVQINTSYLDESPQSPRVRLLHTSHVSSFLCTFWSIALEKVDGNGKIPNAFLNFSKTFLHLLHYFLSFPRKR